MKKIVWMALLLVCIVLFFSAVAEDVKIPAQTMKALNENGISYTGEMLAADQDTLSGEPLQLSVLLIESEGKYSLVILHENKDRSWRLDGASILAAYQNDELYNHIPIIEKNSDVRFTVRYTHATIKNYFQEFVFTVYQDEWVLIDAVLQGEKRLVLRWWPMPDNKTLITLDQQEMTISQRIPFSEFDLLVHLDKWHKLFN